MPPPPKKKVKWRNATLLGSKDLINMDLHKVCGHCQFIFDADASSEVLENHVLAHYHSDKITMCQNCQICVAREEQVQHINHFHQINPRTVKFELNTSLIELRIFTENLDNERFFSNFWGILTENGGVNSRFREFVQRNYEKYKSPRSLCVFRILDEKLWWQCGICADSKPVVFNETIGMRAFALSHLERFHQLEVDEAVPGFFDFEWNQLQNETDFDTELLMQMSRHRMKWKKRSLCTFYTLDLSKIPKGPEFETILKRKSGFNAEIPVRFCLVCCNLVENSRKKLATHFRQNIHEELEATIPSSIFSEIAEKPDEFDEIVKIEVKEEIDENFVMKQEGVFNFPQDYFNYSRTFKDLRRDHITWKCLLCPSSPPINSATWVIMRMNALRHIDDHHAYLFTQEFLNYEWRSIRQEMAASFDIRNFTPLQYTLRGENTFNTNDPNDYVMPQQCFFLPETWQMDTVICGFCYQSFSEEQFLEHIVIHGYPQQASSQSITKIDKNDPRVPSLMGQPEFSEEPMDNETHKILTVEGKRVQTRMNMMMGREMSVVSNTGCSGTPREYTPRRIRKSAHDARQLLSDTFQILKDATRNQNPRESGASSSASSSSSSDDENSEDEKMEESLMSRWEWKLKERTKSPQKKRNLDRMKPAEIRQWIRLEAVKRGVELQDSSDSEATSSESETSEDAKTSKWSKMKPEDIKKLIKEAAEKNNVQVQDDSENSSDDNDC